MSKIHKFLLIFKDKSNFDELIKKHFKLTEKEILKLRKLDLYNARKISKFIEIYLENTNAKEQIDLNWKLIFCIALIEATIGTNNRPGKTEQLIVEFYENNLTESDIIAENYKPNTNKKNFIKEIKNYLEVRHDLLHRCERTPLPSHESAGGITFKRGKKGLKGEPIAYIMPINILYKLTKKAIGNYLIKNPKLRKPETDLKIYSKPKKK